ncbi:hypothetical protein ACHAPU_010131 [Fusarium lateritium]
MAILPNVKGLSVRIVIDGEPADEFKPPTGSSLNSDVGTHEIPNMHRFIESQSRRPYAIEVDCQSDFHFAGHCNAVIFDATVDGSIVLSLLVDARRFQRPGGYVQKLAQRHNGTQRDVDLVFQDLQTIEDAGRDIVKADLERLKTLGTIKVVVHQAKISADEKTGGSSAKSVATASAQQVEPQEVALKALILDDKGHTHGTRYVSFPWGKVTTDTKRSVIPKLATKAQEAHQDEKTTEAAG